MHGWGRAKSYISGLEPSFRLANIGKVIGGELLALQRLSNFGTCLSGALIVLLPFADVGTVLVRK